MAWATLGIYVHITLFFIILEGRHATERSITVPAATAPGDIIIGGIFPIHEDVDKNNKSFNPHPQACVRFQERDLGKALAMINAIETINKSPLLADINITLGYRIMDSCSDVSTALRATQDLTQERDSCQAGSNTSTCIQPVMAVIGASHSEMSIAIARQLTLKMIPQISYFSTAVILSDKNRFPAFMRTIPNDKYQTAAMVMLLRTHGWNWVGIVTMDGNYGRSALEHFMSAASEKGICVAFKSILPQSVTSEHVSSAITHTANTIFKNPKAHVIVSFAKPTLMMFLYRELKSQLTKAGGNMESMRRVWVASDIWSSSGSMVGNCTLDEIGHILGFSFKSGDMTSFRKYLSWLEAVGLNHTGNNPFMQELYNNLNASDASGDTELASKAVWTISEHTHADSVLSVEMAVSAIAQAVVSICRSRDCKTPGTVQPWQVLKALWMQEFNFRGESYKFDSSGDINLGYDVIMWRSDRGKIFVHEIIAHYHPDYNNFTFTNNSTTELQRLKDIISKCSNSCIPGEFKKTTEGQHTCCYECMNCTENYFSNSTDMDQCLSCDKDEEWSRKGSSRCTPKEHLYFSWNDIFAVVLLTLSALGILLALLVSALFLHQRETPVVKAAGGPLSQAILFSLVISYISAIMFVGRPNNLQCRARQVLFGISFTLCVSCILVKTLQILLAFQFNPELQVVLRKLYKPYAIIIICVALQAVTCIVWLVLKSPYHHTIRQQTTVLEHCHEGSYLAFGVMLAYIAILSFVCFICAFKGRKLPEQYNEAKFITFSMLLYLISWLLFVPIYVTTSGMYLPAVEMVVILISNYGILSCHFFPKCYIIFFKREQNTKSAFRKTLYEYSSKSSDSFSTSGNSVPDPQLGGRQMIHSTSSLGVPATNPLTVAEGTTNSTVCHKGTITGHCYRRSNSV